MRRASARSGPWKRRTSVRVTTGGETGGGGDVGRAARVVREVTGGLRT